MWPLKYLKIIARAPAIRRARRQRKQRKQRHCDGRQDAKGGFGARPGEKIDAMWFGECDWGP
jgi:hypothetical protein